MKVSLLWSDEIGTKTQVLVSVLKPHIPFLSLEEHIIFHNMSYIKSKHFNLTRRFISINNDIEYLRTNFLSVITFEIDFLFQYLFLRVIVFSGNTFSNTHFYEGTKQSICLLLLEFSKQTTFININS